MCAQHLVPPSARWSHRHHGDQMIPRDVGLHPWSSRECRHLSWDENTYRNLIRPHTTDPPTGVALDFERKSEPSTVARVFAVVRLGKFGRLPFLPQNLFTGPPGMQRDVRVPFHEVPVDRCLRIVQGLVIAVVDDRPGHTTEHQLDHVEELCTCWQWCGFNRRSLTTTEDSRVVLLDAQMQVLRDVPGRRIPGKVQLAAVAYFWTRRSIIRIISAVFFFGL